MPSAFVWQRPMAVTDAPWQPTLVYPARGVATLGRAHRPHRRRSRPCSGRVRACWRPSIAPRSTTELARRMGVSAGGVSQHLGVLREAGLVSTQRDRRSVLYVRTPLADSLVRG